jgi:hypothetical protein
MARGWLPSNVWLQWSSPRRQPHANVMPHSSANGTINFYRTGGGCGTRARSPRC